MSNKQTLKDKLYEKVRHFEKDESIYKHPSYKEAELRLEFLDNFWRCLGWKIGEQTDIDSAYRDVKIETTIKGKHPDYQFQPEGKVKFFCEAKKPAEDLLNHKGHIFQAKRYAFSYSKGGNKAPFVVLTDFEEFRFFKAQTAPNYEHPENGLIKEFDITYKEYLDRFDDLWNTFGYEAVKEGSLNQYLEKDTKNLKTLDRQFLADLIDWRELLAKKIIIQNPNLSELELNEAVQRIIDRFIFIRMMEDREVEEKLILQTLLEQENIYKAMITTFQGRLKDSYNGLLFNPHFSESLNLDNKTIKDIVNKLYYPKSPYRFDVMDVELLGRIYEKFLGSKIRITESGKRCKVEEKPEVRHAGGVYYTPQYIVDYIVENTVGKLIEGKTPKQIENVKILDPACGSGSFLLGAFNKLIRYHEKWYRDNLEKIKNKENGFKGYNNDFIKTAEDEIKLSITKKKDILKNNIFGVDIDREATEVSIMSLYLKLLEEGISTSTQMVLWAKGTLLPDMTGNIKCGNSLIDFDILDRHSNKGESLFDFSDEKEAVRINPFNWNEEFKDILSKGGFDCVIGNPPYISIEVISKDLSDFFLQKYSLSIGRVNSFELFIQKAFQLNKKDGYWGFIVPNRLLTNTQLVNIREKLLKEQIIYEILSFKRTVFEASVDTIVFVCKNKKPYKDYKIKIKDDIIDYENKKYSENELDINTLLKAPKFVINLKTDKNYKLIDDIIWKKSVKLQDICDVKDGIILGSIKDLFISNEKNHPLCKKWLEGNEVSAYSINWKERYIKYDNSLITKELERKKQKAKEKTRSENDFKKLSRSGIWLRKSEIFESEKILTRQNAKKVIATYDNEGFYVKNSLHCILPKNKKYDLKYILSILNSKLIDIYFQNTIGKTGEIFSQMKIAYMKYLPIHLPQNETEEKTADELSRLAQLMLDLNKQKANAKSETAINLLDRQIRSSDDKINEWVYRLYGLSEGEIKIVEDSVLG